MIVTRKLMAVEGSKQLDNKGNALHLEVMSNLSKLIPHYMNRF